MHFAIAKLHLTDSPSDPKDLHALVEKLRTRFKVCAAVAASAEESQDTIIAVAALASTEERLSQTLDAIAAFCETAGFGRVDSEETLMDHLDALADYHAGD